MSLGTLPRKLKYLFRSQCHETKFDGVSDQTWPFDNQLRINGLVSRSDSNRTSISNFSDFRSLELYVN